MAGGLIGSIKVSGGKRQQSNAFTRAGVSDLAVLDESEDVLEAVVVEEDGLQDRSVRAVQDLGNAG